MQVELLHPLGCNRFNMLRCCNGVMFGKVFPIIELDPNLSQESKCIACKASPWCRFRLSLVVNALLSGYWYIALLAWDELVLGTIRCKYDESG